ncbi:hypothetical protein ACFLYD_04685, partial [Chloroflexota bacterium]
MSRLEKTSLFATTTTTTTTAAASPGAFPLFDGAREVWHECATGGDWCLRDSSRSAGSGGEP